MIPQPTEPPETLSARIARLRAARGWTQEQLAVRLAASRVAVSHFELGLALPSERTVVLLAGLFKIEPQELVDGTSYPPAKAERLPSLACRYTEAELQLALLRRDLAWAERLAEPIERERLGDEWGARIDELRARALDPDERAMLDEAARLTELLRRPRPKGS
jgi:transcriptional regulator with XRE-family HTH domain